MGSGGAAHDWLHFADRGVNTMAWLQKIHGQIHVALLVGMVMNALPGSAQTGLSDLYRLAREDRQAVHAEIAGRMNRVLVALAAEFRTTRDQAMVDHHRTNNDVHAHFGSLTGAAAESGVKVHLCNAGKPDRVGDDWLIAWYEPTPGLQRYATPKNVRDAHAAWLLDGGRGPDSFWVGVGHPPIAMMGGLPVPEGLVDCYPALVGDRFAMAVKARIPVAERRTRLERQDQGRACPTGEVGSGIRLQRRTWTVENGFDETPPQGFYGAPANAAAAGAVETPPGSGIFDTGWVERGRLCFPPDTGTRFEARDCSWIDDGGVSRRGVRIVEVGWTEAQDPNDGTITITVETGIVREVVACGDWGTEDVHNEFNIPVYERRDVVWFQERKCGSEVHPGYAGGTWKSQQVRTTVTTRWPAAMNRPDRVTEARTEMSVDPDVCTKVRGRDGSMVEVMAPDCENSCHRNETRSERERETRSCPAGYTGSETWMRTRTFTWRDYADPVPHVADHRVADSESAWGAWTRTGSTCARITINSDDDDDNNGGNTGGTSGGNTEPYQCLTGRCRNNLDDDGSYTTIPADDTNDGQGNNQNNGNQNNNQNNGNQNKCFLTTAVVERLGEADDGPTLTLLRTFRDGWLMSQPDGERLISDYYRLAPLLVEAIPPTHEEWDRIASGVEAAAKAIRTGNPEGAHDIYRSMVERLAKTWLNQ